jgi:hypothetical protein
VNEPTETPQPKKNKKKNKKQKNETPNPENQDGLNENEEAKEIEPQSEEKKYVSNLDIDQYPEGQLLMCAYDGKPMLVYITNTDISLPAKFF